MKNIFREPVSGLTHLFGAIISLVGMILIIRYECAIPNSSKLGLIAVIIFGLSLIFLYTASSVYHLVKSSDKVISVLRKLDHSMIYVLIAGTYTPICLIALEGTLRWVAFLTIWSLAIIGVSFKMVWFNCPRKLSTFFYVLMGWLAVFLIYPLSKTISINGLMWLLLGGILYTLGAVIYAVKWPRIKSEMFGFHEIFHLFVLGGSFCHYLMIFKYVL
ncbi:hemolysin III family protein [Clostridium aestuarii]|uniref:Hemolysin III family protein n=1 Tax=Clostridium aestuarii TaxID=338193 RepID=A0ABT4CY33_9CLOT|nr:hemolysin III family protein [Clostridium aestuarii]MCY6483902.1 hemolysin III family protein [Clostridium aestuarii]